MGNHMATQHWLLVGHLVAMVAWFAALFYLPRLYVYHADTEDEIGIARFETMERRLYRGIMWPAAIATTVFGYALLLLHWNMYLHAHWMHFKLICVALLWGYHLYCGHLRKCFVARKNPHSSTFYRFFNEVPTLLLIAIIIAAIVKP